MATAGLVVKTGSKSRVAQAITVMQPVVAPAGTVAVMCVSEVTVNEVALVPLKATVDAPVKPLPVSVTLVPTAPLVGEKLVIESANAPSTFARNTAAMLEDNAEKNV